jgi:hypothetical protein
LHYAAARLTVSKPLKNDPKCVAGTNQSESMCKPSTEKFDAALIEQLRAGYAELGVRQ